MILIKEDELSALEINGIPEDATQLDRRIFKKITDGIYKKIEPKGHSYIPLEGEFRVSSIAKCKRKILLDKNISQFLSEEEIDALSSFMGGPYDSNPEGTYIKFGATTGGQLIHEFIQEALGDIIESMEEEITLKINEVILKGHYDLLIKDNETNERIVIDIKTMTSHRKYLPNKSHLLQLMAYQGILGGIRGAILYVNRSNWELTYVPQAFDKDQFSRIVLKVLQLHRYEKNKELPPREPEYPEECGGSTYKCKYYTFCYPDTIEIIEEN